MAKEKKIDINRVKETFESCENADLTALGLSLVAEVEFMKKTMEQLKKKINEDGVITEMSQGKYSIQRSHPAIASYNTMMKNYNSTIKQINDLLKPVQSEFSDNFEDDDL